MRRLGAATQHAAQDWRRRHGWRGWRRGGGETRLRRECALGHGAPRAPRRRVRLVVCAAPRVRACFRVRSAHTRVRVRAVCSMACGRSLPCRALLRRQALHGACATMFTSAVFQHARTRVAAAGSLSSGASASGASRIGATARSDQPCRHMSRVCMRSTENKDRFGRQHQRTEQPGVAHGVGKVGC